MTVVECPREPDVLDAIASNRWPGRCDDELRGHVATCGICADVAEVAYVLHDEYAAVCNEARVPSSGLVWWRVEMRARQEAARAAARPITIVQGVAAACAAGAGIALAGLMSPWLRTSMAWMDPGAILDMRRIDPAAVTAFGVQWGLPLAVAAAAWLVLAPVAIYLVFSDE